MSFYRSQTVQQVLQWVFLSKEDEYFHPEATRNPHLALFNDVHQREVVELQFLLSTFLNNLHDMKEPGAMMQHLALCYKHQYMSEDNYKALMSATNLNICDPALAGVVSR